MGNRAVITTKENFEQNGVGLYLHWNGGRDSVEAFLKYCELKQYPSPEKCLQSWVNLWLIIQNYFGDSQNMAFNQVENLDCDNWDNGTYIIEDWKIVDRKYFEGAEQNEYDLVEMLMEIDMCQPKGENLTPAAWKNLILLDQSCKNTDSSKSAEDDFLS